MDKGLLERLCKACGISGDEKAVRDIILSEIEGCAEEIKIDNMGNILVFKRGKNRPRKKLLIAAHMDEVGFIITDIREDGTLKFDCVGGINNEAVFARQVLIGDKKIPGVVSCRPVHLLKAEEKGKCPDVDSLVIDIGADTREEAEKYVRIGDSAVFDAVYEDSCGRIISKAVDDRFGCLVLIEMIKNELPFDMHFAFCVQEEVGLRGSTCAAYTIAPDSSIVIEATTAADIPGSENENKVCLVGGGAVVSFMDRSTIYDREYYDMAFDIAERENIPVQTKTKIAGGNDAGAIHRSRSGVRTIAVSVPCRYIHSCSSLVSHIDAEAVMKLVPMLAERIAAGD